MDSIKLESSVQALNANKLIQKTNCYKIRILKLPRHFGSFKYYPKQKLLLEEDFYRRVLFYSVNGNKIQLQEEFTKDFNERFQDRYYNIFLENNLIIKLFFKFVKFNIEDFSNYKSFNVQQLDYIQYYEQINRKYYITNYWIYRRLRIYSSRNLKLQNTISKKFNVKETTYFNYIVQTRINDAVYYFNQSMSKQIRKYSKFTGYLNILNSNYLFEPIYEQNEQKMLLTFIKIYDICNMKLKGVLKIKTRNYEFHSFLYIKDFNTLAILYTGKQIDLYNLKRLKFKRTKLLQYGYLSEMRYDKENGLTIFQWPDTPQSNND